MLKTIEIELDKFKVLITVVLSIAFAIFVIRDYFDPISYISKYIDVVVFVFSVIIAVGSLIKLFSSEAGVVISPEGVSNNTIIFRKDFVSWKDIVDVDLVFNRGFAFIQLKIKKSHKNTKNIYINANFLKVGHQELFNLINEYYTVWSKKAKA